jgi:nucleoside 2-deoxyribosyltransferase
VLSPAFRGVRVRESGNRRGFDWGLTAVQYRMVPIKRIIYLACPYTDPEATVREERFRLATEAAAALIKKGHVVFSPITMTHPIDVVLAGSSATLGSEFWVAFDEAFMDMCSEMMVLDIEGWDQSNGIRREMEYFKAQGKAVRLMSAQSCAGARTD